MLEQKYPFKEEYKMKKLAKVMTLSLLALLATGTLAGCSKDSGDVVQIGISQFVEHAALDAAREGFIDALKEAGYEDGKNIEIDFQNAQADMATAQSIAQNFVTKDKDLILAIATPSAQAAYNATKDIPIVITAVTDPVKAGIAKSLTASGTNVTGTSDATPMEKQFELLKELVPTAKKIGMPYTTSEANSEVQVAQAKALASKFGFEIVTTGITNVNEIPQALTSLINNKVDAIYVPTYNTLVSATPVVAAKCLEAKIPFIGSEKGQVEGGALATEGIDYYNLGYQTGKIAVEILKGKKPSELPITTLKDTELVINTVTAGKLGITIPDALKKAATLITK